MPDLEPTSASDALSLNVLVKDLLDPHVVAAIARRRFFSIKDKDNLTSETWETFRNCQPRSSESQLPEEDYSEGYETPVPDTPDPPDIRAERNKSHAIDLYNTLIQRGGRPTRPIRFNPRCKTVMLLGDLHYVDAQPPDVLFYERGATPGVGGHLTKAEFVAAHWGAEREQFAEELQQWQRFRDSQQRRQGQQIDESSEKTTKWSPRSQDPYVRAAMNRWGEWREYQAYFQRHVDQHKEGIERARQAIDVIEQKGLQVEEQLHKGHNYSTWMRYIKLQRETIAAEERRLGWVKQQLPAVLSECATLTTQTSISRRKMEESIKLKVIKIFNTLTETGGIPTRPIRAFSSCQNLGHTDYHLHVLCHWDAEYNHFEEELKEWNKFLQSRRQFNENMGTNTQKGIQCSTSNITQVALWKDYQLYQRQELDNAAQWVKFWERRTAFFQCLADDWAGKSLAKRYKSSTEEAQSCVEIAQKQVLPLEMRLKWVEARLKAILAEHSVSTPQISTFGNTNQAERPRRTLLSCPDICKDAETSIRPDQYKKNKKHASIKSVLGPTHGSNVSKLYRKKASFVQRQSKILTGHEKAHKTGAYVSSPPSPIRSSPRRSSRVSSGSEATPAVVRSANAPSSSLPLRRSRRTPKQKGVAEIGSSIIYRDATAVPQLSLLQRVSPFRSKGTSTAKNSLESLAKPRGVRKRQTSMVRRRSTKVRG
ncbi:MAG: hypothetical protein Q9209_004005 [Squamulea sp. 1 TL-2023]